MVALFMLAARDIGENQGRLSKYALDTSYEIAEMVRL
jgi:hypothetical protein